MLPKGFIGSSVEGLHVAYTIQTNLRYDLDATAWPQGIFNLSETPLDSILEALENADFGIFVFSPDDVVLMREQETQSVRDNVLFELGLFIGRLGKRRCFIVMPDNVEIHLPTDLQGVTPATYNAERTDIPAALGPACHEIRLSIQRLGQFVPASSQNKAIKSNVYDNFDENDKISIIGAWLSIDKAGLAIHFRDLDEQLKLEPGTCEKYLPLVISRREGYMIESKGANVLRFSYKRPKRVVSSAW